MSWTLRDSLYRKLVGPSRSEIEALVGELHEADPPILILEEPSGSFVEAVSLDRDGFLLGYETGTEAACSSVIPLSASEVVEVLHSCARGEQDWKRLAVWRPLSGVDYDSPEVRALGKWICKLEEQIAQKGSELSEDGRYWVRRRLIRKAIEERTPAIECLVDKDLAGPVSYEIERLILDLLADSRRDADA